MARPLWHDQGAMAIAPDGYAEVQVPCPDNPLRIVGHSIAVRALTSSLRRAQKGRHWCRLPISTETRGGEAIKSPVFSFPLLP